MEQTTQLSRHVHYLAELRDWLRNTAEKFRLTRQFQPLVRVAVAQDIVADVIKQECAIAREAYASEQEDREASALLCVCLSHDLPARDAAIIRQAQRMILRSADRDHAITDLAAVPA